MIESAFIGVAVSIGWRYGLYLRCLVERHDWTRHVDRFYSGPSMELCEDPYKRCEVCGKEVPPK